MTRKIVIAEKSRQIVAAYRLTLTTDLSEAHNDCVRTPEELGRIVKHYRKLIPDLTQAVLGKRIRRNKATISSLENGGNATLKTWLSAVRELKIPTWELLTPAEQELLRAQVRDQIRHEIKQELSTSSSLQSKEGADVKVPEGSSVYTASTQSEAATRALARVYALAEQIEQAAVEILGRQAKVVGRQAPDAGADLPRSADNH